MKHEETAKRFCEAIKTIASKPDNLDNLECYLSHHFPEWLEKFGSTPGNITAEFEHFAKMEI